MNILLVCAAGMSTSLLVSKMEKSAQEQGKDYTSILLTSKLVDMPAAQTSNIFM